MKSCKITVLRKANYQDLIDEYENYQEVPCIMQIGKSFISYDSKIPTGFCNSAWASLYPYVFALSSGANNIYDNWMKDPKKAIVSCSDGFRPVSFLIEVLDD